MTSDKNKLIVLLALAFLLRVTGIGFGPYHPDEPLVIYHALAFGAGDLNPHMFYFSSLFLYMLFFVDGCFYAMGFVLSYFHRPDDFLTLFVVSPQIFYVLGRLVSVIFGTLTVWAVYRLAFEYKGRKTALGSALFMAVCFLHVRDSHFATMDITLTFFITLSLFYLISCLNGPDGKNYWKAVIAAGAASAVKYNGFFLAVPITMAYVSGFFIPYWRADRKTALRTLLRDALVTAALFFAVFFCLSPFVLLDLGTARGFVARLYGINVGFHVSWWNHLQMLRHSLGWALFLLGSAGFFMPWFSGRKKRALLVVFAVFYYATITKAGQPYERYVLALIPISLVWAAEFTDMAVHFLKERTGGRLNGVLTAVLLTALILPKTLYQDYLFLQKNTRDVTRDWIAANIPVGSTLVLDDPGECPRLVPAPDQIVDQLGRLNANDPNFDNKQKRLKALLNARPYPMPNYHLNYLLEEPDRTGVTMLLSSVPFSPEALSRLGDYYLIASETSIRAHPDFYRALKPSLTLIFSVDPRCEPYLPMSLKSWTYLPIDEALWNIARPGPLLFVFKSSQS